MPETLPTPIPTREEAARWTAEQVIDLARERQDLGCRFEAMTREVEAMKHQLDWFRRQLFGQKSEKRLFDAHPQQMSLGELPVPESSPPPPAKEIAAHTRRARSTDCAAEGEPALFFDETRVPVQTIDVPNPEIDGLTPDQYEVIGQKISHRLAQRPGSYVILKYVRPVIKRCDTQVISCPAAPVGVIEGSRADVSFVAGVVTDKFCYHQPLYRQHQRMGDNGIRVSRPWLTQLTHAALSLLEPVYTAQLESIRQSRVKAMDETPIKAGRSGTGKMKGGYFWPVYGEHDEICFPYHEGRGGKHIAQTLGADPPPEGAVLLTDGYGAYERYAQKCGLTHAQCWAHYLECRFMRSRGLAVRYRRGQTLFPTLSACELTPHNFHQPIGSGRRVGGEQCSSHYERNRVPRPISPGGNGVMPVCRPAPCTRRAVARSLAMAAMHA